MVKILIGFDHELFLGENFYDHKEILIKPTFDILKLLKSQNVTATLFTDVCCVLRHRSLKQEEFVHDIESQLIGAINDGFDVQLHIHANWLYSTIENGKWKITPQGYRIHEFGFSGSDNSAVKIIKDGVDYLNALIQPINRNYRCVAFRAGGYSIQPHSEIVQHLRANGILIDSSVCRHQYTNSNANKYDFRNLPNNINWWLTPNKDFIYEGELSEGGLFEVPICGDQNTLFKRFFYGKKWISLPEAPLKGSYVKLNLPEPSKQNLIQKLISYNKSYALVSFDSMPAERIFYVMKQIARNHNSKDKDVYVSIIGHPKLCNQQVLSNMAKFIDMVNNHKDEFCFISFQQLYNEILK